MATNITCNLQLLSCPSTWLQIFSLRLQVLATTALPESRRTKFNYFHWLKQEAAVNQVLWEPSNQLSACTISGDEDLSVLKQQRSVSGTRWQHPQHSSNLCRSKLSRTIPCSTDLRMAIRWLFWGAQSLTPASSTHHFAAASSLSSTDLSLSTLFSPRCFHRHICSVCLFLCHSPVTQNPIASIPPNGGQARIPNTEEDKGTADIHHDLVPPGIPADGVCFDCCLFPWGAVIIVRLLRLQILHHGAQWACEQRGESTSAPIHETWGRTTAKLWHRLHSLSLTSSKISRGDNAGVLILQHPLRQKAKSAGEGA